MQTTNCVLCTSLILTLTGCPGHDFVPLDPNWNVPPIQVPICPLPNLGEQHARIELWGDITATNRCEFLRGLRIVRNDCDAPLWMAIECLRCNKVYDFWTQKDVPKISTRCTCGEWLIRYLNNLEVENGEHINDKHVW